MTWYKNNKGDKIWWLDNGPRVKGKRIFLLTRKNNLIYLEIIHKL